MIFFFSTCVHIFNLFSAVFYLHAIIARYSKFSDVNKNQSHKKFTTIFFYYRMPFIELSRTFFCKHCLYCIFAGSSYFFLFFFNVILGITILCLMPCLLLLLLLWGNRRKDITCEYVTYSLWWHCIIYIVAFQCYKQMIRCFSWVLFNHITIGKSAFCW